MFDTATIRISFALKLSSSQVICVRSLNQTISTSQKLLYTPARFLVVVSPQTISTSQKLLYTPARFLVVVSPHT
jgi:hypothetical protein